MSKFITSIRLQEATERDYVTLSQEMKKNSFIPVSERSHDKADKNRSAFVFNTTSNKSLLDTTTAVSLAAATTGKKYSFTLIREKSRMDS